MRDIDRNKRIAKLAALREEEVRTARASNAASEEAEEANKKADAANRKAQAAGIARHNAHKALYAEINRRYPEPLTTGKAYPGQDGIDTIHNWWKTYGDTTNWNAYKENCYGEMEYYHPIDMEEIAEREGWTTGGSDQ